MQYFKSYALQLLRNGYQPLPVQPGYKYPKGLMHWETLEINEKFIKRLLDSKPQVEGYGVGIRCGEVIGVDIDVTEEEIVSGLKDWCFANIGPAVCRVGKAPKALLVYRTEENLKKQFSAQYKNFLDQNQKIEILAKGQQFVAFATHPDTSKPYTWTNSKSILSTIYKDLPLITKDKIDLLFTHLEQIKPMDWVKTGDKQTPTGLDEDLAGSSPKIEQGIAEIKKALSFISSEEYKKWIECGMALYHQFDGSGEGFTLWDEWSQGSKKYDAHIMKTKWSSFEINNFKKEPITARSLIHFAKEGGYQAERRIEKEKKNLLQEYLERFVYVTDGDKVCDLKMPPSKSIMKLQEFKNTYANIKVLVKGSTPTGKSTSKSVPLVNVWFDHPDRANARGCCYVPNGARKHEDEYGLAYINTFHFPDHGVIFGTDRLALFNEHFEYLFPVKQDRKWFLQWMAFNIQKPHLRCKVTPLHISRAHGTGRGWISSLMDRLLGPWNCSKTKMSTLCGEGAAGGFQDYMHQKLFCSIEEVKEGSKRYEISDKIRDYLESSRLEVNLKYGGKATIDVYVNFFLQSNYIDAIYVPREDRRIQPLRGPDSAQSNAYYAQLYAWLEDRDNISQLWNYLLNLDISNFNFQRSELTDFRARIIDSTLTDFERVFINVIDGFKQKNYVAVTHDYLLENLYRLGGENLVIDEAVFKAVCRKYFCGSQGFTEENGELRRAWLLASQPLTEKELREKCVKG